MALIRDSQRSIGTERRLAIDCFRSHSTVESEKLDALLGAEPLAIGDQALGITVRRTIDTVIATRCIESPFALLHGDRDFDPFVTHLGLRSALD